MLSIISNKRAIDFLEKPRRVKRGVFSEVYIQTHPRGAGSPNAMINYAWEQGGSILAVARITVAPYGNGPAKAAVGKENARHCLYLQRQYAVGISHQALVDFISQYVLSLRKDLGVERDYRYLLSLDDRSESLIYLESGKGICSTAASGRTYIEAGALYGGITKSKGGSKYVLNGQIRSLYNAGKTLNKMDLRQKGARIITENPKHRFVWILAPEFSKDYQSWRLLLPRTVVKPATDAEWVQPRLLMNPLLQN